MRIGKPLPSSIATLSLGPGGVLLTKSVSDQPHVAVSIPEDSNSVRIANSLALSENHTRKEEQLLNEAHGEGENPYERGGELALYAMFVRVAGRRGLLVFVFLLSISIVGVTYPRECPFMHNGAHRSESLQTSTRQRFTSNLGSYRIRHSNITVLVLSQAFTWV